MKMHMSNCILDTEVRRQFTPIRTYYEIKCTSDLHVEEMISELAPPNILVGMTDYQQTLPIPINWCLSRPLRDSTGYSDFQKGWFIDYYRPLSLLPTVSKLFGKIVFGQFDKYSLKISCFSRANMDFENFTLLNLLLWNWSTEYRRSTPLPITF